MNYIHIGYPKNFSTSLQRTYFAMHPDLYHLGVGTAINNIGYIDKEIEIAMELYLRTCKHYKYVENKHRIQKTFDRHFEIAKSKSLKLGVSAEHFSFSYSYDSISTYDKAIRLREIFQDETRILIFLRSQKSMIESLYKESIRTGIFVDFKKYVELFYKYQDRNYYYDLAYTNLIRTYQELFGVDNVEIFFFEEYKNENGLILNADGFPKLIHDLNNKLSIKQINTFEHHNQALDESQLVSMLEINKSERHNLGQHLLEAPENHRLGAYFNNELKLDKDESEIFNDVLVKRANIKTALQSSSHSNLDMMWPENIGNRILNFYSNDNNNLKTLIGRELPHSFDF